MLDRSMMDIAKPHRESLGLFNSPQLSGRYSPTFRSDPMRRMATNNSGNFFGGLDDSMLARVEALAAVGDMSKNTSPPMIKSDTGLYAEMTPPPVSRPQMTSLHSFGESMLDQITAASIPALTSMNDVHASHHVNASHNQMYSPVYSHNMGQSAGPPPFGQHHTLSHHALPPHSMHDLECDPRELEAFAERFKQRRIKLGVTQADVGHALGNLKLPGVGSLSQSTICRFESLTLSHNNMIALKPVLQAWLEDAERAAREKKQAGDAYGAADKKRKRTSIAAPEKRSLEAYFAVQPRPSGEKIAQIAEKLDLKKNVVRVWFCNQRQKQKRMKFSAQNH